MITVETSNMLEHIQARGYSTPRRTPPPLLLLLLLRLLFAFSVDKGSSKKRPSSLFFGQVMCCAALYYCSLGRDRHDLQVARVGIIYAMRSLVLVILMLAVITNNSWCDAWLTTAQHV